MDNMQVKPLLILEDGKFHFQMFDGKDLMIMNPIEAAKMADIILKQYQLWVIGRFDKLKLMQREIGVRNDLGYYEGGRPT